MIPEQLAASLVGMAGVVCVVIAMAIAVAAKRRTRLTNELEQRLAEIADAVESMRTASHSREQMLDGRLTRLEQMIDTVAVETERIGEGQRHVSKLLVAREAEHENDKPR